MKRKRPISETGRVSKKTVPFKKFKPPRPTNNILVITKQNTFPANSRQAHPIKKVISGSKAQSIAPQKKWKWKKLMPFKNHAPKRREELVTIPCEICNKSVALAEIAAHQESCLKEREESSLPCLFCGKNFSIRNRNNHELCCPGI